MEILENLGHVSRHVLCFFFFFDKYMFYVYFKTSLKIKVHWGHTWSVSLKCLSLTWHAKDFGGLEFLRLYCMCLVSQLSIQKEEAKKKEVHVEENVPAPSPRSNCSVMHLLVAVIFFWVGLSFTFYMLDWFFDDCSELLCS